jgi:arylsulfatase A-like enzyme
MCVAASLAVVALSACRGRSPDVIVVLIDTLRADHVGAYGGPAGLTPFLDSFAASGVTFTNAYSTSTFTNTVVASLFTSRYPSQHHVASWDSQLGTDELTLATVLGCAGYRSYGFVANLVLAPALGFGRGFDSWFAFTRYDEKQSADEVNTDALRFYDQQVLARPWSRWTRRPLFLYLHYMEPHAPYDPPESARRDWAPAPPAGINEAEAIDKLMHTERWDDISDDERTYLAALYRAEVASIDASLANLFQQLQRRGILDHAVVVITADHGEEFREHGMFTHGSSLFEEVVRIPLIISGPGLPSHRVVTDPGSIVDVAPTVLDLLGLPREPRFEGRSLREVLAGGDSRDIFMELLSPSTTGDLRRHAAGLLHGTLKVLEPPYPDQRDRRPKAYDLRDDPHEMRPDPPAIKQEATALEARLAQRRDELTTRAGAVTQPAQLDDAARARLRALGYAQ